MEYLKQFIDGLKFLERFDKEFRKQNNDYESIEETFNKVCSLENETTNTKVRSIIEKCANEYVHQIPVDNLIKSCNMVSYDFYNKIKELFQDLQLYITVGNVIYKETLMYDLSKQKLKSIINQGVQPDKELPVHVWLTLDDMTVYDLTIIPTLISNGLLNRLEVNKSVLVWRENDISGFKYVPLLVDNNFIHRVDNLKYDIS